MAKRVTRLNPEALRTLFDALSNLVARFPLEGYAPRPSYCKCLQFEDLGDCRHQVAIRALNEATNKKRKDKR